MTIREERNASNAVTKMYFTNGVQISGSDYYYTRDHLCSIRELTGTNGAVLARYDYDPYGQQVQLSGTISADFGYTGFYVHQPSGVLLAPYREYSAPLGRWISRDPLGEAGGINLYEYVKNDPIRLTDRYGLDPAFAPDIGITDNAPPLNGSFGFVGGKAGGPGPLTTEGLFIGGITPNNKGYGGALLATGKECKAKIGPARFDIGLLGGVEQTNLGTTGIGLFDLDLGFGGVGAYWSPGSFGLYGYGNYGDAFAGAGVELPK